MGGIAVVLAYWWYTIRERVVRCLRPERKAPPKLTPAVAFAAVARYGELMERHGGSAFLDASLLPLPKTWLKLALKMAWTSASDEQLRDQLGGRILLSTVSRKASAPSLSIVRSRPASIRTKRSLCLISG
jgi:hypothetical protein